MRICLLVAFVCHTSSMTASELSIDNSDVTLQHVDILTVHGYLHHFSERARRVQSSAKNDPNILKSLAEATKSSGSWLIAHLLLCDMLDERLYSNLGDSYLGIKVVDETVMDDPGEKVRDTLCRFWKKRIAIEFEPVTGKESAELGRRPPFEGDFRELVASVASDGSYSPSDTEKFREAIICARDGSCDPEWIVTQLTNEGKFAIANKLLIAIVRNQWSVIFDGPIVIPDAVAREVATNKWRRRIALFKEFREDIYLLDDKK